MEAIRVGRLSRIPATFSEAILEHKNCPFTINQRLRCALYVCTGTVIRCFCPNV